MAVLPLLFSNCANSAFYNNVPFFIMSDHVGNQDCPAAEPEEEQKENL